MLQLSRIYWVLAFVRVCLVFIPQTGYIHPDEFFQTTEVLSHKIFEIDGNIAWEFNVKNPIRGMSLPICTIGTTYQLYKLFPNYRQWLNPYLLLIGPRLTMCLLSFLVDFSLYSIFKQNNEHFKNRLVVLAGSYVMYVYGTHTFSNTLEMICFAGLLYYVSEAMIDTNTLLRKKEYLKFRENSSTLTTDQFKFARMFKKLKSDELRNAFQVATISVCGFFLRPTFVLYAIFPVFFWLYRGIGMKFQKTSIFHIRIYGLILYSIPAWLINIIVDSFFYGYITWGEIGMLDISLQNFVFTPWNFIMYNMKFDNLAKHGLHPRFLHILVNLPLCFNILGIIGIIWTIWAMTCILRGKPNQLPTVRSIRGLMLMSFLAPLILLSVFPHQEPRFLIPLILPLVYLFGNEVYEEKDKALIAVEEISPAPNPAIKKTKTLLYLWLFINLIFGVFYGFLHQRGVYPTMKFLNEFTLKDGVSVDYFIVSSYTYTLPETLALKYNPKIKTGEFIKRMHVHDGGSDSAKINTTMLEAYEHLLRRKTEIPNKLRFKFFFICPQIVTQKYGLPTEDTKWRMSKLLTEIPLHVSTEALGMILEHYFIDVMTSLERLRTDNNMLYSEIFQYLLHEILHFPRTLSLQIWQVEILL